MRETTREERETLPNTVTSKSKKRIRKGDIGKNERKWIVWKRYRLGIVWKKTFEVTTSCHERN